MQNDCYSAQDGAIFRQSIPAGVPALQEPCFLVNGSEIGSLAFLTKGSKRKKIKNVSSGPYGDAAEKQTKEQTER